jgi:hypothetical protein
VDADQVALVDQAVQACLEPSSAQAFRSALAALEAQRRAWIAAAQERGPTPFPDANRAFFHASLLRRGQADPAFAYLAMGHLATFDARTAQDAENFGLGSDAGESAESIATLARDFQFVLEEQWASATADDRRHFLDQWETDLQAACRQLAQAWQAWHETASSGAPRTAAASPDPMAAFRARRWGPPAEEQHVLDVVHGSEGLQRPRARAGRRLPPNTRRVWLAVQACVSDGTLDASEAEREVARLAAQNESVQRDVQTMKLSTELTTQRDAMHAAHQTIDRAVEALRVALELRNESALDQAEALLEEAADIFGRIVDGHSSTRARPRPFNPGAGLLANLVVTAAEISPDDLARHDPAVAANSLFVV